MTGYLVQFPFIILDHLSRELSRHKVVYGDSLDLKVFTNEDTSKNDERLDRGIFFLFAIFNNRSKGGERKIRRLRFLKFRKIL